MKIHIGDCIIYNKGNAYHEWGLFDFARRRGYPIKRVNVFPKYTELVWLKYASKGIPKGSAEVRFLHFEEGCKNIHKQLSLLEIKKSIYCITVSNREQYLDILKLNRQGMEVKTSPKIVTYKQKVDMLSKVIRRSKIEFSKSNVKDNLIRLMIRNEDSWDDVIFSSEMLKDTGSKMTIEDLEDIYPDESFYNLDNFLYNIIMGIQPRKTIEMAKYFLTDKEYSARWISNKLKEKVMLLSYMYQFYRRGVFNMVISPMDIRKRINFCNINGTVSDNLDWDYLLSYGEQKNSLKVINGLKYTIFQEVSSKILKLEDNVSESDIYGLIKDIQELVIKRSEVV